MLLLTLIAADTPWWKPELMGEPLPAQATVEADWPHGVEKRCGWIDEVLYCAAGDRVDEAWRRIDHKVEGTERVWLRTAGLELRSFVLVRGEASLTYGNAIEPYDGWQAHLTSASGGRAGGPEPIPYRLEGAPWGEQQRAEVERRLSHCALDGDVPLEIVYDSTGQARLVRVQTLELTDGWQLRCIAVAVGGPSGSDSVEIVLRPR